MASTYPYFDDACTKHCEYINGKSELYKHFESVCPPKGSDCPDFYEKCKAYNPNIVLKALNCHKKLKTYRGHDLVAGALQDSPGQKLEPLAHAHGPSVAGYTPVGSWVRKLGGYSPNSMNDTDGREMEGFLDNAQGSGNMFFDSGENYISYQPM
ncbi:PIR Superfamily Protein [Plasmodium ovale wallikeri]|uniref:PIR Superfamily Protein n=1 Tax=Plasmodium ovale wallikeri TaxID=864142 RepID=A0A1A9AMT7_PLAOA|nr:PIR Superfamily Protein [Plasmodium ovale wallikeri]